jgi:hypothetical protein
MQVGKRDGLIFGLHLPLVTVPFPLTTLENGNPQLDVMTLERMHDDRHIRGFSDSVATNLQCRLDARVGDDPDGD